MNKNIISSPFRFNKSKPLGIVEPLNCTTTTHILPSPFFRLMDLYLAAEEITAETKDILLKTTLNTNCITN